MKPQKETIILYKHYFVIIITALVILFTFFYFNKNIYIIKNRFTNTKYINSSANHEIKKVEAKSNSMDIGSANSISKSSLIDNAISKSEQMDDRDIKIGSIQADIKDDNLLQVSNLGRDSERFIYHKNKFYNAATQLQRQKGKNILLELRNAIRLPNNTHFKATVRKQDSNEPYFKADCFFKKPEYYKEKTLGNLSYDYITDGSFEITNYGNGIINRKVGITPKDMDKSVFLEAFPARLMMDSDLVWNKEKIIKSPGHDYKVNVISNWLCDYYIRADDNLIENVYFYDRNDRSKQIVSIFDIKYKTFIISDDANGTPIKRSLPIEYKIQYNDNVQSEKYNVSLEYTNFDEELSKNLFNLKLQD